jgi:hypothetical protein
MATFLLGLLIAAAVGAYIFVPYLLDWDEQEGQEYAEEDLRDHFLTQLAELEYDFRAGKVGEADYRVLRRELEGRFPRGNRDGGHADG